MAFNRADFMYQVKRRVASVIPFVLALSTLSAVSIVTAPSAQAATAGSGNCVQTFTASSGSGTVTVTEANGFCYVAFKNTGAVDSQATISWQRPTGLTAADVLVIGGGGGGGARHAGGGGAGGYVEATSYALTTSSVNVVIGAGGKAATGTTTNPAVYQGTSGQASSFTNPSNSAHGLTALGGGFGAYNATAGSGGSGGGSGWAQSAGSATVQGQTTLANVSITGISFGNVGRPGANEDNAGLDFWAGGGGGGAGARGENPKPSSTGAETTALASTVASTAQAGAGGIGKTPTWLPTAIATTLQVGQIDGSSVYFAGGGGGGMGNDGFAGGAGGLGGGGNGTKAQKTGGIPGTAFTGGGGGSSGFDDINVNTENDLANPPGGAGGSGVVVLRYGIQPSAPTITGITGGSGSLSVAFTPATQAGVTITGYKFSTDGGSTWSSSTGSTTSPISIPSLTNGTTYQVQIRAVSAYWDGVATASTSAIAGPACSSPATTTSGGNTYVAFKSVGSCTWTPPANLSRINLLVVGGGGGGASRHAGGGGAGGLLNSTNLEVNGTALAITVGGGGAGGAAQGSGGSDASSGGSSEVSGGGITKLTAVGGGGGSYGANAGLLGGSGGGGGSSGTGGLGTAGQGNAGSSGATSNPTYWVGGGGGGAGGAGTTSLSTKAGSGGAGLEISWIPSTIGGTLAVGATGTAGRAFAGGGGGGSDRNTIAGGNGGAGGGAAGSSGTDAATAGSVNTGGGGGGSGISGVGTGSLKGGDGGSGVVVIRYVSTYTVTYTYNGADAGNSTTSTNFNLGGSALELPSPTKSGFTFSGWYTASSGGSLVGTAGASYTPTGTEPAITVHAQWVAPSGTVNVPSAPHAVSAVGSNGSIALTWAQPVSLAGKTITNYQVEHSTTGAAGSWVVASSTIANNATSYTITGLNASTSYYVRVVALFSGGRGAYGYPWQKIYGTSTPTRSSGAIVYQSGFGTSAGDAFSLNPAFTRIRYLMKATYGGNPNYADVDFAKGLQNASSTSNSSLDSITSLRIPSTASGQQFVTQGDVFDLTVLAPSTVTVQNGYGFNGRVEIWPWNYAVEAPSGVSARSTSLYDDSDTSSGNGEYGSFQLHNITNGSSDYRQTILAWNRQFANTTPEIGFGSHSGTHSDWTFCFDSGTCTSRTEFSLEIFVNAPIAASTTSDAPTNVTATRGNGQATVSWSAPASNGGSAITGYTVTSSPSVTAPAGCTNTSNLSCTFTGLTNGTAYTFTVVAINGVGNSSSSTASAAVTPATVPGAPTALSVTGSYKRASISWSAPTSNGGSAVTGYTVTSSPSVTAPAACANTANTSCVFTGLTAGTAYTFTVVATNGVGNSLSSSASSSVTPFGDCVVTQSSSGGYKTYVFTTIGMCGWVVPSGASKLDVAAVGGGGGAAFGGIGGGGGGGRVIVSNSPFTATPGDVVIINVGKGGAGGWNATQGNWSPGANGDATSVTIGTDQYSASGGGGGGGGQTAVVGSNGGSGGGGAGTSSPKAGGSRDTTSITGFTTYGNNGGAGTYEGGVNRGGGGGGASEAGNTDGIAAGGDGIVVWGVEVGGGGGGWQSGVGGTGGGGSGFDGISTASSAGSQGTDGLGGGGGGGQKGGTGRVMIRFIEQITITPTVSPTSITFGSSTSVSTSFTQSLTYALTTNPTCEIYSDAQRTNKVSTNGALTGAAAAALAVGTYFVNCSNAVATNGPTISYASDATFTVNAVVLSPALVPTFGTPTRTSDGFTVTITNYDAAFTWETATVTAGIVSVTSTSGSNRVLTVTGLNPGASATITQTTSRSGYSNGSATVTGTASATVTSLTIGGVTAPVRGATPVTTITAATGYTGTVTWAAAGTPLVGNFAAGTVYTATITLTATAGYTFNGVTANSFTVSGATATNLINSGVITAVFPATIASITYSAGTGGSGTAPSSPTTIAIGGTFTTPFSLYTRAGYSFAGWNDGIRTYAASATYPVSGTVTGNVVLTAQWIGVTYTVLFAYNGRTGGDSDASKEFTTGGTAMTLPTPTRTGYTFGNWFSNIALTTQVGIAGANYEPTSNLTLYAKWNAVNYTVTYNSTNVVGGSTINSSSGTVPTDSANYNIGQNVSIKSNSGSLARTGYTFTGWVTSADGTGTAVNSGQTIEMGSQSINLYPKWTANTYTIIYNLNGGTGDMTSAPTSWTVGNSDVTLPTSGITRTGYTFGNGSGGYWSSSQGGAAVANTYSNIGNVTLYAIWTVNSIPYSFSKGTADGLTIANFPTNSSSNFGSTLTLPNLTGTTVTISSNTHLFSGWSFNNTIYQSAGSFVLSETEPTFTAIWTRLYDVQYGFAGGTKASADVETNNGDSECVTSGLCAPNQEITLRGAPTRTGYQFAGWKVQDSVTIKAAGTKSTITDSAYLFYAQWTAIDYEFSFNSTGGSNVFTNETKNIGQLLSLPDPGFKTGYVFAGWSADSGVTKLAKGSTYVVGSSSQAFVAIWTPNVYTIVFDWQGATGSVTPNATYTVGTGNLSLPTLENRVKDGYIFAGWGETVTATALVNYQPVTNKVLYALWTDGNYSLTLNGNGATVATEVVPVPRNTSYLLPTRTRPNFKFVGWFDSATGGNFIGNAGVSYLAPASQTIFAHWVQDSFFGVDEATLEIASTFTASNSTGVDSTLTHTPSSSSARVQIQPGALPAGTVISVRYFKETSRQQNLIGPDKSYFFSVLVSWILGTGATATVPDTASDKPILVTLTNSAIRAGAMVYRVIGGVATELQRATVDGSITVELRSDPELVIAATKPTAPRDVTASSSGSGSSDIAWQAPSSNGGSAVIEYTASVANDSSKSCTTVNLTCTITGLTNATNYSFVVTATNGVGISPTSTPVSGTTGTIYTVTFNSNGGTIVADGSFLTNSTVSEPVAPSRAGYTFAGWSATNGGSAVTFPYAPGVANDITMFARWDAINHVVTFDSKSGSNVTAGSFPTGGTVAEPVAPTRSGFTFAGWSATDGGPAITFPYSPGVITNIILYARWTAVTQGGGSSGGGGTPAIPAPSEPVTQPAVPEKSNITVTPPVTVVGDNDAKVISIDIKPTSSEPGAKPLVIKLDAASEKFIAEVKVVEGKLVLTPETGFSGKKTVTITITENGFDRIVQIPLTVLPETVTKPVLTPTASNRSTIRWTASPNATTYTVFLNGKRVCSTSASSCSVSRVLGPDAVIEIISNGGDRTVSEKIEADFRQSNPVAITRLVSATITKATLTKVDTKALDKIIALIKVQGFRTVVISEITTTSKTKALAAARIESIKKYISSKIGTEEVEFEVTPVKSRTYFNNISVKG
jgi:uncharacterized repeat protein (TIGR02543 family)